MIVKQTKDWSFEHTHHHLHGHYCYHTRVQNAAATFKLAAPNECSKDLMCSVSLMSLFTWNTSYIGLLSCTVSSLSQTSQLHDVMNVTGRHGDFQTGYILIFFKSYIS